MGPLWRWISLRHLRHEGVRTLLTLLGVALGVAVFVSIRLANHSALAAFGDTVDAVAGRANLQVEADSSGFDERIFPRLRRVEGVRAAAPVIQAYVRAAPGNQAGGAIRRKGVGEEPFPETLLLLGLDIFSEEPFGRYEAPPRELREEVLRFVSDPSAAAIPRELAERRGLRVGDTLTVIAGGRPRPLTVAHVLDSEYLSQAMGGSVVVMDIAAAQELLERYGRLDRIDLIVDAGRMESVRETIRPLLPPHAELRTPQARTRQVENMVSAFALNLTALSFIALFVSIFLIYNAVSMAVLRRRGEIGLLRSVGTLRRQIVLLFLGEALAVGLVGSMVGLALGTLLARLALGAVARTVTTLYLTVYARDLHLDPAIYAAAFLLGVVIALLSALAPALEAARIPPGVAARQGVQIEARGLPIARVTAAGMGVLLLAAGVALWTVGERRPAGGFVSAFLVLIGFSLLAPAVTLAGERLLGPAVRKIAGVEGLLGARYLRDSLARTAVVVAALMVSVGMLTGLATMVGSFRRTVTLWVGQTVRGDLYVEPVGRSATGSATVLDPSVIETARRLPGVRAVDTYRAVQISYRGRLAHAIGVDFAVQERHGRLQFLEGEAAEILARARERDGVVVTESFAFRHQVRPGDILTLATPAGPARLPVEGIFYDYSTDAGALMMDYRLFWRLWRERRTESFALYLEPGKEVEEARDELIRAVGERMALYVTPNQDLRRRVLQVFDQTFQITYALQAIAIMVAVLGVIGTLTALILQRGREIGVLRAVGALRSQVRRVVLVESGLIGLIGSLLGCACGVVLSLLLTYVINKQFFGWSIRLTLDPWLFVQSVALMVTAALLAGLAPARLAAGRLPAEAMRCE